MSQDYAIFHVEPIVSSWDRLAPTIFASHVMNAFNDATKVFFDTRVARNNMFPFFPDVPGNWADASRLSRPPPAGGWAGRVNPSR